MRYFIALLMPALFLTAGCKQHTRPEMPPIPLRNISLHDVQPVFGGNAIWALDDGSVVVQVVGTTPPDGGDGLWEKRYRIKLGKHDWAQIERLVGSHEFLCIRIRERDGTPDEGHPLIQLRTKDDVKARVRKWANDKHADFDPVYEYLRSIAELVTEDQLVHEGVYDWDWRPEGFDRLW